MIPTQLELFYVYWASIFLRSAGTNLFVSSGSLLVFCLPTMISGSASSDRQENSHI